MAQGFAKTLPLPRMVAQLAVGSVGQIYIDRLEKEATERGPAIIDENAVHLRADSDRDGNITITLSLPKGWEQRAIGNFERLVAGLYQGDSGPSSWVGFAEWLWVNLMTRALEDLEGGIGVDVLDSMSDAEFNEALLGQIFEHKDSTDQLHELVLRHAEMVAEVVVEALAPQKQDLWILEYLLGLRERPPEGAPQPCFNASRVIAADCYALLHAISQCPEELYRLAPRRFEELVAEIFAQFGYEVQLTPESRDGGFDISAIRRAETDVRILIECKRYTPPRKVSRPIVQQLYGVLGHQDATKGIIATTASFSADAKAFCGEHPWRLEARDRNDIIGWIEMIRKPRSGLWIPDE